MTNAALPVYRSDPCATVALWEWYGNIIIEILREFCKPIFRTVSQENNFPVPFSFQTNSGVVKAKKIPTECPVGPAGSETE